MDLYTLSFFLSTMWVGPFWFGMLVFPEHELTQKAMQRQYELEDGNIILYECTINNCAKKIISRKTVAYPVDTIQN